MSTRPFGLGDPRQQRIYEGLKKVGRGPAEFYRDACVLMQERQIRISPGDQPRSNLDRNDWYYSVTHLVGHLAREIESSLRDVIEPRLHREKRLARKKRLACKKRSNPNVGQKSSIRACLNALDVSKTDPIANIWLGLTGSNNPDALHRRAHRNDLEPPRKNDAYFRGWWDRVQWLFDVVLKKVQEHYVTYIKKLDGLVKTERPTKGDLSELKRHIPNNLVLMRHFFENLEHAEWLKPLTKAGFFNNPPEPEYDSEGSVRFIPWPALRYLIRMARRANEWETVGKIANQIPDTENVSVHDDMAQIALILPADRARDFVPRIKKWLHSPFHSLMPSRAGELVVKLLREGEHGSAIDLTKNVLAVEEESRNVLRKVKPKANLSDWDYTEFLKETLEPLVEATGTQIVEILCDTLASAMALTRGDQSDAGPDDLSSIWRKSIDKSNRGSRRSDVNNALVTAICAGAEQVVQRSPSALNEVIRILEKQRWYIFQRIVLHLLRKFKSVAPELVSEWLVKRKLFDSYVVREEYNLLLQQAFGEIDLKKQMEIIGWIKMGLGEKQLENVRRSRRSSSGQAMTALEMERYKKHWQIDRFLPIKDVLTHDIRAYYDQLVQEVGEPTVSPGMQARWGPNSPKSIDELHAMSVQELSLFLRQWTPERDNDRMESKEGLARDLKSIVAENPTKHVESIEAYIGVDPTYIRAFFEGFQGATKTSHPLSWEKIIQLMRWVIEQPIEIPGRTSGSLDQDPDWRWTRKSIARLLMKGFESGPVAVPLALRAEVWKILKILSDDLDPTPEREAKDPDVYTSPLDLAINTTRGEAMQAVIRYALWIQRSIGESSDSKTRLERGFQEMEEVREVLDYHLSPANDPSVAVRAIYGLMFPQLTLLDSHWASQNASRIFSEKPSEVQLRDAAWNTYLNWCEPYNTPFKMLLDQYRAAIDRIESRPHQQDSSANPQHHLGFHIMIQYGRGIIPFEDDNLVGLYIQKASPALRGSVLSAIGHGVHQTQEVPPEFLNRFKQLWERRVAVARQDPNKDAYKEELASFGWWFASKKYEVAWAIKMLGEILQAGSEVDPGHLVVERLAESASACPIESVHCLSMMIEISSEEWAVDMWKENAITILEVAVKGEVEVAREAAIALINRLVSMGHKEFMRLLE